MLVWWGGGMTVVGPYQPTDDGRRPYGWFDDHADWYPDDDEDGE